MTNPANDNPAPKQQLVPTAAALAKLAEMIAASTELTFVYTNWCNMLWNWSARKLHNILTKDAVEDTVLLAMFDAATIAGEPAAVVLLVNPARPINYAVVVGEAFMLREVTNTGGLVR